MPPDPEHNRRLIRQRANLIAIWSVVIVSTLITALFLALRAME